MKALIITALSGFINAFLQNDIKILQEMGYEVHCAADDNNKGADAREGFWEDLGVVFHQVRFDSKNPLSKNNLTAYKDVSNLLKAENFNVVHCHTPISGFIVRLAANKYRRKGMKVIYSTHGFYFHKKSPKKDWLVFYPIEKIASLWSDAIITINNEDYNCAKKMWSKQVYKINSVGLNTQRYLDVDIDRDEYRRSLGLNSDDIVILAAGELSDRKNHKVVVKALGKLNDPRYVFVICGRAVKGSGTYDLLQKLAEENNVRIRFLGFRTDMPCVFRCADICVMPSKREGLGMVGLQALICGIPLVTSNVHGIVDYMKVGETGYMYDPDDADGFAEGIQKLSDSDVRECMKPKCIEMAMRFSMEVSMGQMKAIYGEVLGEPFE